MFGRAVKRRTTITPNDKEYRMSQIGEPLRIIEVEPLEEPVPEKEVPFEQPADPVKEPA